MALLFSFLLIDGIAQNGSGGSLNWQFFGPWHGDSYGVSRVLHETYRLQIHEVPSFVIYKHGLGYDSSNRGFVTRELRGSGLAMYGSFYFSDASDEKTLPSTEGAIMTG
jgi:hypothetical protein